MYLPSSIYHTALHPALKVVRSRTLLGSEGQFGHKSLIKGVMKYIYDPNDELSEDAVRWLGANNNNNNFYYYNIIKEKMKMITLYCFVNNFQHIRQGFIQNTHKNTQYLHAHKNTILTHTKTQYLHTHIQILVRIQRLLSNASHNLFRLGGRHGRQNDQCGFRRGK